MVTVCIPIWTTRILSFSDMHKSIYLIRSSNGRYYGAGESMKLSTEYNTTSLVPHCAQHERTRNVGRRKNIVLLTYFYPKECSLTSKRPCSTEHSLVKHLIGSSWVFPGAQKLSRLYSSFVSWEPSCCSFCCYRLVFFLGRWFSFRPDRFSYGDQAGHMKTDQARSVRSQLLK